MKDYYLLVGLNSKEIKIFDVNQKGNGLIEVVIESRKNKVRCPICNRFTSSVHDKLKPIRSVYLDSCGSNVDLIIYKKRYHCYKCNKTFTEELNINSNKGNISNTFLCIGSFNINAYLPSAVSALNSSNDITLGKLTICLGIPEIIFNISFYIVVIETLFLLAIYFNDKL